MKIRLFGLCICCAITALLFACGGASENQTTALPPSATTATNGHVEITQSATDAPSKTNLYAKYPGTVTSIAATVKVTNYYTNGAAPFARVRGVFYNDGFSGAAAGSNVGDIWAGLLMDNGIVKYQIARCIDPTCINLIYLYENIIGITALNEQHLLSVAWDSISAKFSFQLDGNPPVIVDPTPLAPVVTSTPTCQFQGFGVRVSATTGQRGTMTAQFDNLTINGVLYDDFASNAIDASKWNVLN